MCVSRKEFERVLDKNYTRYVEEGVFDLTYDDLKRVFGKEKSE